MPLAPGTRLSQYEILAPIGAGSMGEVYRARDSRLDRDVAIKVLPDLVSSEPDRLQRFETEAKAAAALNHPNILAVYQMGTYAGVPYLVSELLEGMTLTESIRRGPLPLRRAIDYGVQIAHGLAAAHEKGIVHRDLKPDNLFVTKDGRIKILDFGLAKVIQPKESLTGAAPTLTIPGVAMGTMGYMSPEQVRGLATDHRTDIFAFGAILYEMVMGKRSFEQTDLGRYDQRDSERGAATHLRPCTRDPDRVAESGAALFGEECGATVSVCVGPGLCSRSALGFGHRHADGRACDQERRTEERRIEERPTARIPAQSFPNSTHRGCTGGCAHRSCAGVFLDAARPCSPGRELRPADP